MNRKSPQKKKELSYQKDRRNLLHKPQGIRKLIAMRKSKANRAHRRAESMALTSIDAVSSEEADVFIHRKGSMSWKKDADNSLADAVARTQRKKEHLGTIDRANISPMAERAQKSGRAYFKGWLYWERLARNNFGRL